VTDLRERRRLRTRHAISAAAVELFAREGYDATSVAQVAAAAEVSPRTVFRHFPDKEELLFGDDELLLTAGLAAIREAPAGRRGRAGPRRRRRRRGRARGAGEADPRPRGRHRRPRRRCAPASSSSTTAGPRPWAGALADRGVEPTGRLVARAGMSAATWALGAWVRDGGDVEARVDAAFAVLAEELG
jgi:AcrR family transcriptional regulator